MAGKIFSAGVLCLALAGPQSQASAESHDNGETIVSHGISVFGDLKYGPDFEHFDYVNPDAPKGGIFSTWGFGTFDNLNAFILKGTTPVGASIFFESLMEGNADEPDAMYGLLAETIEYPENRQWAIFTLREEARFSDGSPVRPEDVVFSYEVLLEKGHPSYKVVLSDFETVEKLDDRRVKYTFKEGANTRELPMTAAGLPVFSATYWEDRDFAETTLEPPVGSGPYLLKDLDLGRSVTYVRDPDYWGKDLPINRGRQNFDELLFEYFADYTAAFEGFKGGTYLFRTEYSSLIWGTGYENLPALEKGWMIKESVPDGRVNGAQGFFFNLRREKFSDPRVRIAIGQMFNFEWSNETLFYGIYSRTDSFWENSYLQAEGMPSEDELKLLEPLREHLPEEVFTEPAYSPNVSRAQQLDRSARRTAGQLLDEAGWTVGDDGMRRNEAGEILRIEIMNDSPSFDRIVNPYIENLRKIGIDAVHLKVDNAQATEREKTYDFDITTRRYALSITPGMELRQLFSSAAGKEQGSANLMGLANPAVDALIGEVERAKSRDDLTVAVHALDRVMRALHIWVPQWHNKTHNIAFFDVYRRPDTLPPYAMGETDFWWYDAERARELQSEGAF
ncbi:ABC transporter substrate-binding protein [Algicella marina]|uniref:ABC transporter substrate-binding protein n=1 Tax=Algicella marina TaxID=2683284 RepID=A0A6P1T9D3_9RHOB|nr:ABC transporter substrate-binding protein [Algicella marina]